MNISIHPTSDAANANAADLFAQWLTTPDVRNVMLATGNTPLELYRLIGERRLPLAHLNIFALDEYVGVPLDDPRNSANVLRRAVIEPWGIAATQFFSVSSVDAHALANLQAHERRIAEAGGIDVIVLGLGQNGHLGFNEPGTAENSLAHVPHLDPISIEANRKWFNGDYAPSRGATVGLKTILSARRILIMAYGAHKTAAAKAMHEGSQTSDCPASFLQNHGNVNVFLDDAAAAALNHKR